jgi:metal-responsive CopG/Arc/MetJ family transcriptional regulator
VVAAQGLEARVQDLTSDGRRVTVVLPGSAVAGLDRRARVNDRSRSAEVRRAVERYLVESGDVSRRPAA